MIQSFYRVLLCLTLIALAACVHQQVVVKRTSDLAACYAVCKDRYSTCSRVCHNNCRECTMAANCRTKHSYSKYINEMSVKGGIVSRELNSFRDPLQCRKTTCNCTNDYTVCMQSCKGVIYKRLQVPSACC